MTAVNLPDTAWHKSSRSDSEANSVEIAELPEAMAVRDAKDPDGPVLVFSRESWADFVAAVRAGEFDLAE